MLQLWKLVKLMVKSVLILIVTVIWLFVGLVMYWSIEKDVSRQEMFQNIAGKTFEIQQTLFITKFENSKDVLVNSFRNLFYDSKNYNEFLQNPEKWKNKSGQEVIGTIDKGTKLAVEQVYGHIHIETGHVYRVVPTFNVDGYEFEKIDASNLFERNLPRRSSAYYFNIDESLLKEVKGEGE